MNELSFMERAEKKSVEDLHNILRKKINNSVTHPFHEIEYFFRVLDVDNKRIFTVKWPSGDSSDRKFLEQIYAEPRRYLLFFVDSGSYYGIRTMLKLFVASPASMNFECLYSRDVGVRYGDSHEQTKEKIRSYYQKHTLGSLDKWIFNSYKLKGNKLIISDSDDDIIVIVNVSELIKKLK